MTRLTEALPTAQISTNRLRTALGLVIAAGLVLGSAACDRKDASAKAITGAGRTLESSSVASAGGGGAPAYVESRLNTVRKDVKDLGSNPSASDTASASLISARASGGLAGLKAAQAASLEEEARRIGLVVYASLDAHGAQSAFAASMEQFDPAPETKRLTDEVAAKEQEISKAAAARRQLQDEAAKLEADAQAALTSAQAERATEAQLRAQAQTAGTRAKTDLITQANQHRRTADGFDKKAADLRAQAVVLAPRIEGAQGEFDHLTNQRKLLQDANTEVQGLAQTGKQRATEARAAVAKSAEDIAALMTTLEAKRAEIEAPAKSAMDGFNSAAADARKASQGASREGGAAAKVALAGYLANAGSVAAGRADGYRAYASLLEALGEAKPALANSSKYASSAAEARKAETEAREEAKKLFGQAKEAVSGAGAGEELKAVTEKIGAALDSLSQGNIEPAKSLALGGAPSKAGAGARPGASPDEAEILSTIQGLPSALKSNGLSAIFDLVILPPGPVSDVVPVVLDVDAAMREKFSVGLLDSLAQMGAERNGRSAPSPLEDIDPAKLEGIKIEVTGDTAVVSEKDSPTKVPLRKVDGKWKVDVGAMPEAQQFLPMAAPIATSLQPELKALAADIRAGKFADAKDFFMAAMPRIKKALGPLGAMLGGG